MQTRRIFPMGAAGLLVAGCGLFEFSSPTRQQVGSTGGGSAGVTGQGGEVTGQAGVTGFPSGGGAVAAGGAAAAGGVPDQGGASGRSSTAGTAGASSTPDGGVTDCSTSTESYVTSTTCASPIPSPDIPSCMQAQTQTSDRIEVIDDFADCNACLRFAGGRTGFWHGVLIHGTLRPELLANPDWASNPNLPRNVIRLAGETTTDGGNYVLGLELWPHGSNECDIAPVDLAAYAGISFWLRSATGASMDFTVVDQYTLPPSAGNDRFNSTLAYDPNIFDGFWHFYSVPWAQLVRRNPGAPVDPHTISVMTWEATNNDAKYDMFLGDVELMPLPDGG